MDLYTCIITLYPNAKVFDDFTLVDNGNGAYIETWKLPYPKPTTAQLNTIWKQIELENERQSKIKELNTACESTILGRFKATLDGVEYEFSYDAESQSRFNGVGLLFLGDKITEIPWTAYLNGVRVRIILTKDNFDTVSLAALKHQNTNIIKFNELLAQASSVTSIEQVRSVKW